MVTTKDKLEFVYAMARHSSLPLGAMYRLMRYAATYQRIMEHHCNGTCPYQHTGESKGTVITDDDVCVKAERIEKWIINELSTYECKAQFSGDPRGCCVKITVPDGYTNDMGQEGICVPA